MTASIIYQGNLRNLCTHSTSSTTLITDAPKDNQGQGASFSPTDLVATALAACMLTIMGIKANENQWNIVNTEVQITKIMGTDPRRITEIKIDLFFKEKLDPKTMKILENCAKTCPVAYSLHPDIYQNVKFHWL